MVFPVALRAVERTLLYIYIYVLTFFSFPFLSFRLTGFYLNLVVLMFLIALGTTGIVNSFLDEYLDFSIGKKLRKLI